MEGKGRKGDRMGEKKESFRFRDPGSRGPLESRADLRRKRGKEVGIENPIDIWWKGRKKIGYEKKRGSVGREREALAMKDK